MRIAATKVQILKTVQPWYGLVSTGDKPVEIRKNDRDFQPGDVLILRLWDEMSKTYPGGFTVARVATVLSDVPGLLPEHVCLVLDDQMTVFDKSADFLISAIKNNLF